MQKAWIQDTTGQRFQRNNAFERITRAQKHYFLGLDLRTLLYRIQEMRLGRKAIAFLLIYSCISLLQSILFTPLAYAETWVMVAKSDSTLEQQYVDADSIYPRDSSIQLKTYWGFLDQPDSINYATTEYRCATEEYRDVVVNGEETGMEWTSVGADPLNRAAMDYGCHHVDR